MVSPNQALVFDALGNEARRQILEALSDGPRPVVELSQTMPISRPAVSKHLTILQNAGLVSHKSDGNRNVYSINPNGFREADVWIGAFWKEALIRFKIVAENTRPTAHPNE